MPENTPPPPSCGDIGSFPGGGGEYEKGTEERSKMWKKEERRKIKYKQEVQGENNCKIKALLCVRIMDLHIYREGSISVS